MALSSLKYDSVLSGAILVPDEACARSTWHVPETGTGKCCRFNALVYGTCIKCDNTKCLYTTGKMCTDTL